MVGDSWLSSIMPMRSAKAPRVRQLETNQEAVIGTRREPMLFDQGHSQRCQTFFGVRGNQQLVGIRASVFCNRDGLATPDQFPATAAKMTPPPQRVLGRIAIGRAIPAFHRLHGDVVADLDCAALNRSPQWRFTTHQNLVITRDRKLTRIHVLPELRNFLERPQAQN